MINRVFLTDCEVCQVLDISTSTLGRIINRFVRGGSGKRTYGEEIDLSEARPLVIGGYRRWSVSALASCLGITREELLARLS